MGLALIGGGCFALPYQHALNTLEPLTAVYGVFIWALLFSAPGAWALRRNTRFSPKVALLLIAISLSGVLGNFAVCTALQGGSPTLVIIVSRIEIVLALLLGWGLLREVVAPKVWVAVGIMLLGITLIRHDSLSIEDGSGGFVLWALITAFSFALMQVLSKLIISQIDPQALNVCRLMIALAVLSVVPGVLGRAGDALGHLGLAGTGSVFRTFPWARRLHLRPARPHHCQGHDCRHLRSGADAVAGVPLVRTGVAVVRAFRRSLGDERNSTVLPSALVFQTAVLSNSF